MDEPCKQPCITPRADCGHPCMAPCHLSSPCPMTACKAKVRIPGFGWDIDSGFGAADESWVCILIGVIGYKELQVKLKRERWNKSYR